MRKQIAIVVGAAAAVGLVLPLSALAATSTAHTTINAIVGSSISLTNDGAVGLSVLPTGGAARTSSGVDNVVVNTNNSAGYNLTLQMSTTNTNLVSGSNTIAATSGSQASPTVLTLNSWGFRVDGAGGFGAGPTSAETNVASSTHTWGAVPVQGSPVTIKTTATPANNDQTKVWYAINVDSSKPTGTYSGTVIYTATTN